MRARKEVSWHEIFDEIDSVATTTKAEVKVTCEDRFTAVIDAVDKASSANLLAMADLTKSLNDFKDSLSGTVSTEKIVKGGVGIVKDGVGIVGSALDKFVQIGEFLKKFLVSFIVFGIFYGAIFSVIVGRKQIADIAMEILRIFIKP